MISILIICVIQNCAQFALGPVVVEVAPERSPKKSSFDGFVVSFEESNFRLSNSSKTASLELAGGSDVGFTAVAPGGGNFIPLIPPGGGGSIPVPAFALGRAELFFYK